MFCESKFKVRGFLVMRLAVFETPMFGTVLFFGLFFSLFPHKYTSTISAPGTVKKNHKKHIKIIIVNPCSNYL